MSSPRTKPAIALGIILALVIALQPADSRAVPFDGQPKILLHLTAPAHKNACQAGALADCREAATSGTTGTGYFAYLLAARGSLPDVAAVECGLTYQNGQPGDMSDGQGIDIFEWRNCATLEFPAPGDNAWPRPGGSNLITWDTTVACQAGETAVAGYFYLTAYSPDELRLIRRPVSGLATVTSCAAVEQELAGADLGSIAFSQSGGCNPCVSPCPEDEPRCVVEPAALDFGSIQRPYGRRVARTLVIQNTGSGVLRGQISISSPAFTFDGPSTFELTTYQSRTFRMTFWSDSVGVHTGSFSLGTGCPSIPLTGAIIAAPEYVACEVFPPTWDFGHVPVGQTATQRFILANNDTVTFEADIQESCDPYAVSGTTRGILAPGQADTFYVSFAPTRTGYYESCSVSMCPSCKYCGLALTGIGGEYAPPVCAVKPAVLDFGPLEVGRTATWYFYVNNQGGECIRIHPDISGTNFRWVGAGGQGDACNHQLWVPVGIEFSPGEARVYECTVKAAGCCSPITLRGEGRLPGVGRLSADSLEFGSVPVGTSLVKAVTLTNTGTATITGDLSSYCGEFSIEGNPGYSLPPGGSIQFQIAFRPTEEGRYRCVIDGGEDSTVLPCLGTAVQAVPVTSTTWGAIKARFATEKPNPGKR